MMKSKKSAILNCIILGHNVFSESGYVIIRVGDEINSKDSKNAKGKNGERLEGRRENEARSRRMSNLSV